MRSQKRNSYAIPTICVRNGVELHRVNESREKPRLCANTEQATKTQFLQFLQFLRPPRNWVQEMQFQMTSIGVVLFIHIYIYRLDACRSFAIPTPPEELQELQELRSESDRRNSANALEC